MRELHDKYFRQAKREGRLARSYYKLEEIDRRSHIFRKGMTVIDLGACPGSWLEYILPKIEPGGVACAVDLNPIHKSFKGKVEFLKKDVRELTSEDFAECAPQFDVVVSDMAPNTSGVKTTDQLRSLELCESAYEFASRRLKPGGTYICKILEGPELPEFRKRMETAFRKVRTMKPDASRDESMETYLVCTGLGLDPVAKSIFNVNQRRKFRKKKRRRQGY